MSDFFYDTRPNPGDEDVDMPTKAELGRTRCYARTLAGTICRNKREKDCRYCKRHNAMYRVTVPLYPIPATFSYMNEFRACPVCFDNVTLGGKCSDCMKIEACILLDKKNE